MAFSGRRPQYRCCGSTQYDNFPSPSQNLLIFEMTGYNYRTIPTWFDEDGQAMNSIQFSAEHRNLLYRWVFYRRLGERCDREYHLSTSDDIVPIIYETTGNKRMKVTRVARHNGYTSWVVKC
jgi:hypothetical protein